MTAHNESFEPRPYKLLRIFCSTPGDREEERQAFHDIVGEVNEAEGISKGVLLVPVSIVPNMVNKSFFQPSVEENVSACKFFVQVLHTTWGPPAKNFESEYRLACRLRADFGSAMKVAVFFKDANGLEIEPSVRQLKIITNRATRNSSL